MQISAMNLLPLIAQQQENGSAYFIGQIVGVIFLVVLVAAIIMRVVKSKDKK